MAVEDTLTLPEGDERDFFFAMLRTSGGPEARSAYRAWLAERGDPRAELFELEERMSDPAHGVETAELAALRERARALLARRGTRSWWRAMARVAPLRNCGAAAHEPPRVRFAFECPRSWDSLARGSTPNARGCDGCSREVFLCTSLEAAEARARAGDCIAVPSDLVVGATRGHHVTGRPDYMAMWAEEIFPDE
jgi:hypothetical protein